MIRVLTHGTFDILHYGHIEYLKNAKNQGDYLVVALSTDEFAKKMEKIHIMIMKKEKEC